MSRLATWAFAQAVMLHVRTYGPHEKRERGGGSRIRRVLSLSTRNGGRSE